MTQLDPMRFDDFSNGVIRQVSKYKMPRTASPFAVNFIFDEEIGKAITRKGTAMVGANIGANPILGLTYFRRRADTNHALLAVISDNTNNDVYKWGSPWAKSLEDDTKDLKTRFVQFLDSVLRINGTDTAKSFNGTTWATTGGVFDLANLPVGKYVANYKDRIHILGDDGTLYSSSVPRFYLNYDGQSANFTAGAKVTGGTSGATAYIYKDTDAGTTGTLQLIGVRGVFANNETITDDNSTPGSATVDGTGAWQISWTDGYITTQIDLDNGSKGKAIGLGVIGGILCAFFERGFYTWNGSSTQADPICFIGCVSQESVTTDNERGNLFFVNKAGVYMTQGGFPTKISTFVDEFFDNIAVANFDNIACGCDGKHLFVSIGSVTIDEKTITNCVLRYTISSQEWAVLSYPTMPRVFTWWLDASSNVVLVYGDASGNVIQIDSTNTSDNYTAVTNSPIQYEIETAVDFEPMVSMNKTVKDRIIIDQEGSDGAKLYYRVDCYKDRHEKWKGIAINNEIKELVNTFRVANINYKEIQYKISGRAVSSRFKLNSIDIPDRVNNGF